MLCGSRVDWLLITLYPEVIVIASELSNSKLCPYHRTREEVGTGIAYVCKHVCDRKLVKVYPFETGCHDNFDVVRVNIDK